MEEVARDLVRSSNLNGVRLREGEGVGFGAGVRAYNGESKSRFPSGMTTRKTKSLFGAVGWVAHSWIRGG